MTALRTPLASLSGRLRELAEGAETLGQHRADPILTELGFVDSAGGLTEEGRAYYLARHVREDDRASSEALAHLLRGGAVATAFCSTLWGTGEVPVRGAVSLLKRLVGTQDEHSAKRWLELMNQAKLIAYNRKSPTLRILHNPEELVPPTDEAEREQRKGHVIDPASPYGNLMALRELLRAAREFICWYEQHLDHKVLEVLWREIPRDAVATVRLLSGPANVDGDLRSEFKRFRREMRERRDIECEWRVLSRKDAQRHHDRLFFSDGIARNLPPLNLILAGSQGEILPSGIGVETFDAMWRDGNDLLITPDPGFPPEA